MYFTLYKTTNSINGKYYYGVYKTKNMSDSYLGSGVALKKAINKYGKDNFKKEVILLCENEEEMYSIENSFINKSKVDDPMCYNIAIGGEGGEIIPGGVWNGRKHKEETKLKMSISASGKIRSEEHCKNISLSKKGKSLGERPDHSKKMTGENNPMFGVRYQWINDGVRNKRLDFGADIPSGYIKGKI